MNLKNNKQTKNQIIIGQSAALRSGPCGKGNLLLKIYLASQTEIKELSWRLGPAGLSFELKIGVGRYVGRGA